MLTPVGTNRQGFVFSVLREKEKDDRNCPGIRTAARSALRLWPELPREVQEKLFETAVPLDPAIRNRMAIFLHDRHPKTAHPPKPTNLA